PPLLLRNLLQFGVAIENAEAFLTAEVLPPDREAAEHLRRRELGDVVERSLERDGHARSVHGQDLDVRRQEARQIEASVRRDALKGERARAVLLQGQVEVDAPGEAEDRKSTRL